MKKNKKLFFKLFLFVIVTILFMACSSEPFYEETGKTENNTGSNNNSNNNNSNNNNGNGNGNNTGNNNQQKTTSLKFTVKVKNKIGETPVSNIWVFISGVNVNDKKKTNNSGICVFDNLKITNSLNINYKVTGQVVKNGVSSIREITGSIKVTENQPSSVIATF